MVNLNDYYRTLGVGPNASLDEIKQAFRKQVKAWHPDLFHNDAELRKTAEEKIKEINQAHKMLSAAASATKTNGAAPRENVARSYRRAAKSRKCADQSCNGYILSDWKCSVCGKSYRPEPAFTRRASARKSPLYLVRCSVCGQMNRVRVLNGASPQFCGSCGDRLSGASRKKTAVPGGTGKKSNLSKNLFSSPSLDFIKFLIFCLFVVTALVSTVIGLAVLLWTGKELIVPIALRYFSL